MYYKSIRKKFCKTVFIKHAFISWHPFVQLRKMSSRVLWRRIRAQTCWATWPQPIPCLSAIQWHAEKEGSQPEKDTTEEQYMMSGVATVMDSDGRRLTRGSGF
uniref:Uncharacterized protein n=1 Tax=Mesocestoides corti TaxID=53468 RepID=A0A5K3G2A3_MESCO